jgi:GR25 family glycosyltransferase involved in LPS biosynthesis
MNENAYIINLEENTDRKNHMINEFKDLSLNLNFVNAIKHSPGWVGCLKSHLYIINMAKKLNLDYVIVLEDDVNILDKTNFNKKFDIIMDYLKNNLDKWQICNLGAYAIPKTSCSNKFIYNEIQFLEINKYNAASFVIYNKSVYDFLLNYNDLIATKLKNTYKIDHIISVHLKTITTFPQISSQKNNIYSDLTCSIRNDLDYLFQLSIKQFNKLLK